MKEIRNLEIKFLTLYSIFISPYKDDFKLYICICVCQHILLFINLWFIYICVCVIIIIFMPLSSFSDFCTSGFQGIVSYGHSERKG